MDGTACEDTARQLDVEDYGDRAMRAALDTCWSIATLLRALSADAESSHLLAVGWLGQQLDAATDQASDAMGQMLHHLLRQPKS